MVNRTGVILAAGQGSRMKSQLPKPLIAFAGKPMVQWVYDDLKSCCDQVVIVVQEQHLSKFLTVIPDATYVVQQNQLGTADALKQSLQSVIHENVIVMCADSPCVGQSVLAELCQKSALSVIAFKTDDPRAYGRVFADRIVESHQVASIPNDTPCNSGIYHTEKTFILEFLNSVKKDVSGEYLLTDWVAFAASKKRTVDVLLAPEWRCTGVNTMQQKVQLERVFDLHRIEALMAEGCEVHRPESIIIRGHLEVGQGVVIEPGCLFEGDVTLQEGAVIEQGCQIKNSAIGAYTRIKAYTTVDGSELLDHVTIGPYAHVQQSKVGPSSYIGNYAELKRSEVGSGVKAKHMCYVGDGRISDQVNIGAGTVFCNYDGFKKSITTVSKGVFVGANTSLIAPVSIAYGAKIGAGSVVSQDVPENCLFVRRPKEFLQRSLAKDVQA